MKRKPFPLDGENKFLSHESHKIFTQDPSVTKFYCSNEECTNFLYKPKFLDENIFPNVIQRIPFFLLDSNVSVSFASKPQMHDLLHGSFVVTNNAFGMETDRYSHVSSIEKTNIKINKLLKQYVQNIFEIQTDFSFEIKENKIFLNGKNIKIDEKILINKYFVKFEFQSDKILIIFEKNLSKTRLKKKKLFQENLDISLSIESDIPVILVFKGDDTDNFLISKILRIVALELEIKGAIKGFYFDFLIAKKLIISNNIESKNLIFIRANDVEVKSNVQSQKLIIISSKTDFLSKSSLVTNNFCVIFADCSFKSLSSDINLTNYSFIKSKNVSFRSSKVARKPNLLVMTMINHKSEEEDEEEEEESNEDPNSCYIQAEKVTIGPKTYLKTDDNISIECESLNISGENTTVEVGGKLNLLFVVHKNVESVGLNNGIVKCNDLFFEINSNDTSDCRDCVFKTTKAFTVKNAFLLSYGTFENTGNVVFRSFYISNYSSFKCSKIQSSFKIGDFFVVSANALFYNKGLIHQFPTIVPDVFNCGKMVFDYQSEKKAASKGRKKSENFFDKSAEERIKLYSLICKKFVSNGEIEGDFLSLIADDLISVAGSINCKEINFKANEIAVTKSATVKTYNAVFRCGTFELGNGLIKSLQMNESEEDQGSSLEIFYKNKINGNIENIKDFDNLEILKSDVFMDDKEEAMSKAKVLNKLAKK